VTDILSARRSLTGLPERWNISLDGWIIEDGNYPNFEAGQAAEFAVEFWIPKGEVPQDSRQEPGVVLASDLLYDATAKCIVQTEQITILDIGILVYQSGPVPADTRFAIGDTFQSKLIIGVDSYFYFEHLRGTDGAMPLVYSWRIESIFRQTAPFLDIGPRLRGRDPSRLGYEEIQKTNAGVGDEEVPSICLAANYCPLRRRTPVLQRSICKNRRNPTSVRWHLVLSNRVADLKCLPNQTVCMPGIPGLERIR
jgi:hypothetical protein